MRDSDSPAPFRFCPRCGSGGATGGPSYDGKRWRCPACGFELFRNAATAAGAIIHGDAGIVLLERAIEPGVGKLGLPGGFVDTGERAEDAIVRECLEEIGWAPPVLRFLATFTNVYLYGGVVYDTCDLFFYCRLPKDAPLPALSPRDGESSAVRVMPLAGIRPGDLAFPSAARALEAYTALIRS
jgi:ADP-ribose pyrophosphatase YjhB (NUDIX family)